MAVDRKSVLALIIFTFVSSACHRLPATSAHAYDAQTATTTESAAVAGPLAGDASQDIVSWVDGHVVTDWAAEIATRDHAIEAYLDDADPDRAGKYGFRSGQTPRLAWSWFRDNPVGFNGVPFVLFKTILDLDPNHSNPTLRSIARIWKHEAIDAAGGSGPKAWTLDHIGVEPGPADYVDGVARPANE